MAEQQNQQATESATGTGTAVATEPVAKSTAVQPAPAKAGPPLRERVNYAYDYVRENTPTWGWWTLAGVAVLAVVIFAVRYWYLGSIATASGRWVKLDQAVFAPQIELLAADKNLGDDPQRRYARFLEARTKLNRGVLLYPGTRHGDAMEQIKEARNLYAELSKETKRNPLLHQEALYGAGRASLILRETKAAKEYYSELADTYKDTPWGKEAKSIVDALKPRDE